MPRKRKPATGEAEDPKAGPSEDFAAENVGRIETDNTVRNSQRTPPRVKRRWEGFTFVARERTEVQILQRIVQDSFEQSRNEFGGEAAKDVEEIYNRISDELKEHGILETENMELIKEAKELNAQIKKKKQELFHLRIERFRIHEEMDELYERHQKKRHHREQEDAMNHFIHEKDEELSVQSKHVASKAEVDDFDVDWVIEVLAHRSGAARQIEALNQKLEAFLKSIKSSD